MKVLVIMGSPRKGNTFHATERIREILQGKVAVEWEYVMLRDVHIEQCRGCYTCFPRGEESCPIEDDASVLEQKMRDADGVVFASPVYGFQVSGLMKVFIDRHSYIFHRPSFFRQKALLLTTAGIGGMKDVLDYLDLVARIWGFDVTARVGILTSATMDPLPARRTKENEEKLQKAAAAFLAALQRGTRSRPGLMDVMFFHVGRAGTIDTEELSPADYTYWADRGWLQKGRRYYVDVPVNPVYHSIGILVEWFLRRRFRKDRQTVS